MVFYEVVLCEKCLPAFPLVSGLLPGKRDSIVKAADFAKGANVGDVLRMSPDQTGRGRGLFHAKCLLGQENAFSTMSLDREPPRSLGSASPMTPTAQASRPSSHLMTVSQGKHQVCDRQSS